MGGKNCTGAFVEKRVCNMQPCLPGKNIGIILFKHFTHFYTGVAYNMAVFVICHFFGRYFGRMIQVSLNDTCENIHHCNFRITGILEFSY